MSIREAGNTPAGRDPGRSSRWYRLKFRHFAREAVTFFAAAWDKEAQEPARAVPLPFQNQRKRHLSFERQGAFAGHPYGARV